MARWSNLFPNFPELKDNLCGLYHDVAIQDTRVSLWICTLENLQGQYQLMNLILILPSKTAHRQKYLAALGTAAVCHHNRLYSVSWFWCVFPQPWQCHPKFLFAVFEACLSPLSVLDLIQFVSANLSEKALQFLVCQIIARNFQTVLLPASWIITNDNNWLPWSKSTKARCHIGQCKTCLPPIQWSRR